LRFGGLRDFDGFIGMGFISYLLVTFVSTHVANVVLA
jgi:hypothetical protein